MSSNSGATSKGAKKEEGKRTFSKPNAWSKPLPKTVTPPPGLSLTAKSPATTSHNNADALRERFLHLLLTMVGQKVQITLVDGAVYVGVYHTATPFPSLPTDQRNKIVLQAVSILKPPVNKATATEVKAGQTLVVDMAQVVHLHLKSIRMDALTMSSTSNNSSSSSNNNVSGFQTDTEISGKNSGGSKGLVAAGTAWTTPIASPPTSGNGNNSNSRADVLMGNAARTTPVQGGGLQGSIGGWDQFKANEQLFNVKASYDENLYTTELDKSTMDQQKIEQAEKLAREIEGAASSNPHIAEERGHKIQGDYDEEDLYSGVLNKEQQPKKQPMNWAAAVAKADSKSHKQTIASGAAIAADNNNVVKKTEAAAVVAPSTPKVEESSRAEATPVTSNRKKEQADVKVFENKKEEVVKVEKPVEQASKDETPSETKEGGKSKLNANAKSFSFNINAKSFTPGGPPEGMPPTQPPPMVYDPNTGMPMAAPHMYMHAPVGQPTMVHMMGHPQYPGMRYPYPGMDPQQMHMPGGMPPQGPPPPPASSSVNAAAPSDSAEPSSEAKADQEREQQGQQPEVSQPQDGETSSVSDPASQQAQHAGPSDAHHAQQQQPGVPMHYNMQYYGMYPQQQQRAYPPQFMPPMGRYPMVGPPMHTPYGYPPMAYPYGYEQGPPPMDDGYRGRGGRGGGGRGGGRGTGRGGRSRGSGGRGQGGRFPPNYSNNNSGSGRNTPQGEGGAEGSKSPTLSVQPNPSEGS